MIEHVTIERFINRFKESELKNNFSLEGLKELYSWLSCFDENLGNENYKDFKNNQFDAIKIASMYEEYESFEDYKEQTKTDLNCLKDLVNGDLDFFRIPKTEGFIIEKV